MTDELSGRSRARPLRVAFLVEDDEHSQLALDGIFADCYGRWGGRFSLIVPCLGRRIAPAYWPWLEAYDPDIVYSYVPLQRTEILELLEKLAPAEYMFHELGKDPRLDVHGFTPDYQFKHLASLSVIYTLTRGRARVRGTTSSKIIDCWHTERPSRLLGDNLGTYYQSYSTGLYPADAESAASLLTIVSPERRANKQYAIPPDLDVVDSELAAFREFAFGRATSLSLISAALTPRLEIGPTSWGETFNLVIGSSFMDRLLFWNARLHIRNWLDPYLCSFRSDIDHLRDPAFLEVLGSILKHRNHVNSGSGGTPHLCISSTSLNPTELEEARQLIASTKPWSSIKVLRVENIDSLVPAFKSLKESWETRHHDMDQLSSRVWTHFSWTKPTVRHTPALPLHLEDAPPRQSFTLGYWCVDFAFEHDGEGPRISRENRWMLPKRWRLEGAFHVKYVSQPQYVLPPRVRPSRSGFLVVPMCAEHPVESIAIPTPYDAIEHALVAVGHWSKPDAQHGNTQPPQRVAWMTPSNESRHLIGVLGMAGGLQEAVHYLLHPFLERLFARLGGTTKLTAANLAPTVNRLVKRAKRRNAFNLESQEDRIALAAMIAAAAKGIEHANEHVSYEELRDNWKAHRSAFWERRPKNPGGDTSIDWDALEEASLDACLIAMRRKRLLFQGHAWTCRRCLHKNWVDLGALKPQLLCEVCNLQTPTPVDIRWLFRPNEFLIESLRSHSVVSLLWTLSALRHRATSSILFVGPACFGFSRTTSVPDAEADLLVIIDGKATLCEVKSSWHSLRNSDVESLVATAIRLRPDTALLAVMEHGRQREEALSRATADLSSAGIAFEVLTADQFEIEDDPRLRGENESYEP